MSYVTKSMIGLSVLGKAFAYSPAAAESCGHILVGQYDYELKCVFYHQVFGKFPDSDTELEDPRVLALVGNAKNYAILTLHLKNLFG